MDPGEASEAIIDTHVHIWSDDRIKYAFVPGRERPIEHKGSADRLIELMDDAGVAMAILVQTPWYSEDNRYLVDAMRRFPNRFAAVGYLEDPLADDAPERLAHQFDADGFRGVRLHLTDARVNQGVLAGAADPLFHRALSLEVPLQFLNRPPQHPTILAVADRFPELAVIIDHLGHPDTREAPAFVSSTTLFSLGERPKVSIKISNHVMNSHAPYPWADLGDYQRRVIDVFSPQRSMWGSNWPMQMPDPSYRQRLDVVASHLTFLDPEERAWLLGRTARSLWNLGPDR